MMQKAINIEKQNWREIKKIILDAILFCAKNNISFRGTTAIIGDQQSGIFLNLLKLISKYNPVLKKHIEIHEKGTIQYLSPSIQNEFIMLLGNRVRSKIINKIKASKYFTIMFDCTPDISHREQM